MLLSRKLGQFTRQSFSGSMVMAPNGAILPIPVHGKVAHPRLDYEPDKWTVAE